MTEIQTLAGQRGLKILVALIGMSLGTATALAEENQAEAQAMAALTQTITALDAKVFDAYNRCDLEVFGSYFTPNVEFYHDKSGATFDRASVITSMRKFICNKVRRELVPATLKVYPIKDYGAIEEGEHRFCQMPSGECEGGAKFLMIWEHKGEKWLMTHVVSYGHRALTEEEKATLSPKSAE